MNKWTRADGIENHPAVRMQGTLALVDHCYRCLGRGYIEAFRHVANGICFRCNGHGVKTFEDSNIIERTVAYLNKIQADDETFNRLFEQANNRFYKWLGDKLETESTEMALAIWHTGGHVDKETKYDSQFTWMVRHKVEELYATKGRSSRAEAARLKRMSNSELLDQCA